MQYRAFLLLLVPLAFQGCGKVVPPPQAPASQTNGNAPAPSGALPPTGPPAATTQAPVPECKANADCDVAGGALCCSGICATIRDSNDNCGGCGRKCSAQQFCFASACHALELSATCTKDGLIVVTDGNADDDAAAAIVSTALQTGACTPASAVVSVPQTDASVLDQATAQPVYGTGKLGVFTGGSFYQRGLAYLDKLATTPVVGVESGTSFTLHDRGTGRVRLQLDESALSAQHDYFVVEIAKDPSTSTVAVAIWGVLAPGTRAGAAYFAAQMLPVRNTLTKAWYVVEWTDSNQDGAANAGDTFTVIASG
jgi:hypothetical protein